jgi:hypothetical protein
VIDLPWRVLNAFNVGEHYVMTADTFDHNVGPPSKTLRYNVKLIRFVPSCVMVPRVRYM